MSNRYDVAIHGAGMVGLLLARALAPLGLKIAVIDAKAPPRWQAGEPDLRVSAVTVVSERILRALDCWTAMQQARVSPFRAIQVWDALGQGTVLFDSAAVGESHLGHIVENSLIQSVLSDALRRYDNVNLLIPNAVHGLEREDDGVELSLEDGRRLSASLLVGADGAASPIRRLCDIELDAGEYGQVGLVTTIRTERHHGEIARQRFLPGGPLAFLPMQDGRCSIVWSLPAEAGERRVHAPEAEFLAALTEASDRMLGEVVGCGARAAFPLRRLHARRYTDARVALIGDAAHVIHPLAGQGANLGFLDAAVLAEEIGRAHGRGRDIGGMSVLRRYERRRRADNQLMQSAMDAFHLLFRTEAPWVVLPRSLGLNLTDRLPPAKAFFMRRAMGFGGDLPQTAQQGST